MASHSQQTMPSQTPHPLNKRLNKAQEKEKLHKLKIVKNLIQKSIEKYDKETT